MTKRVLDIFEIFYSLDPPEHIAFDIFCNSLDIEPSDIIDFVLLSREHGILRDNSEIYDIVVLVRWSSIFIHRDIMDTNHENISYDLGFDLDPRLFVELSDRHTEYICLTITVTTELLPTLELLMQHQEYPSTLRIGDQYGACEMSIQIGSHKSEFPMLADP
jgi:hypothetical protein